MTIISSDQKLTKQINKLRILRIPFFILDTVAHINRQVQSRVNLIKVVPNCLKFTGELELMILKIWNYRGVIDSANSSLILSSRRKNYQKDPP